MPVNSSERVTVSSVQLQALQRRRALLFNLVPALGFVASWISLRWHSPTSFELALLGIGYVLSFIGVEVGFHRYFSHNAFRAGRGVRALLAILGSAAAQGPVTYWVSNHRRHHKYVDGPSDPHSPHVRGDEKLSPVAGFWHAHVGWILRAEITNTAVFARDLIADRDIVRINRHYVLWVLLGVLIPAAAVAAHEHSFHGFWHGLLWAGLFRVFLVQQATFAVNSFCHLYGSRPFGGAGTATNNAWLALPTLGGAWHHNHHAFPRSADNALAVWQLDPGAWVIYLLAQLRLVHDVQRPTQAQISTRKRQRNAVHDELAGGEHEARM